MFHKLISKDGVILATIAGGATVGTHSIWTNYAEPLLSFIGLASAALAGVIKLIMTLRQYREQKEGSGNDG